ncbi:hypothetical protein [Paenibacillus sp. 32352]|uniref:hypothetical protein n=1 Tax=Paenibacillus sp. 32352 TaxID=1969111 RepID=UPI00117DD5F0|nr:hypothetical protein [Paenibacillus sp. 32352]
MMEDFASIEYFKELLLKENNLSDRRAVFIGIMSSILDPRVGKTPSQILKRARNLMEAYEDMNQVSK